jgi:hypothetical protein
MSHRTMTFATKAALYEVLTPFFEDNRGRILPLGELNISSHYTIGDLPVGAVFRHGRAADANGIGFAYILCNDSETRWAAALNLG